MGKIKFLTIILAFVMIIPTFASCKNEKDEMDVAKDIGNIVSSGKTDYTILQPETSDFLINTAVSELTYFFNEATGITLKTTKEADVKTGKYISVGETEALKALNVDYTEKTLGTDGFKIITKDDDLYLIGGSGYGTIYAVYEMLEKWFDYDFFYKDCYCINKGVTELKLYEYDITEIPDIPMRAAGLGTIINDNESLMRMRQRKYYDYFIPVGGGWVHNSLGYVESSEDLNKEKWFSIPTAKGQTGQLCYTAHGDKEEYEKMQNACLKTLIDGLIAFPDRNVASLTIQDNFDFCSCDACTKLAHKYGDCNSALVILFMNDLNKKVRDWFETEEGAPYKRDLRLVFFAYNATTEAPATYNEQTQKYEPINGIKLDEGVEVFYAPINANYIESFHDSSNSGFMKITKSWADITDKMFVWYYNVNYTDYLATCYTFNGMQENYQLAVESGADWFFDLGPHDEAGFSTGWNNLKQYLSSKLSWDCNQNMDELIDKFFTNYFGPGAEYMREFFDSLGLVCTYNSKNNGYGGYRTLYDTYAIEKFWPKDMLLKWIDCCDEALEEIEVYKNSNSVLYDMYYKHIVGERISPMYLFVSCYKYNTDTNIINQYKRQVNDDIKYTGLRRFGENKNISGNFYPDV